MKLQNKLRTLGRKEVQNMVLLVILFLMMVFFAVKNPRFLSYRNFINVSRQTVHLVLLGCGMTFIIISGSIDLSVGGVMGLSAVMFAYFAKWGVPLFFSGLLVLCIGVSVGIINGVLTEKLKLPPIMATLATMTTFGGLAYTLCSAIPVQTPNMKPITLLNKHMVFGVIPLPLVITLACICVFLFLEKKTILGKYAIAIGGNVHAAQYSGINVSKMRYIYFIIGGFLAALAGILATSRTGQGDPTTGGGIEFTVIAACILGGINIKGGEGNITGMLIGTFMLALLVNGMNMIGITSFYQQVATGMVLLIAVLIDYLSRYIKVKRSLVIA